MSKIVSTYDLNHRGFQPIRVLQYNIPVEFEKIHSDFVSEVRKHITLSGLNPVIKIEYSEEPIVNNQTPFVDQTKTATIHETFLSYLWCISYTLFKINDNVVTNLESSKDISDIFEDKTGKVIKTVFEYGLSLINTYTPWDKTLPNPEEFSEENREDIEVTNEIFIRAMNFILAHEYAHVICGHLDTPRGSDQDVKRKEYEADNIAFQTILKGLAENQKIIPIGCGLIAGFVSILLLSERLDSATHPASHERLKTALERLRIDETHQLWLIGFYGLMIWSEAYKKKITLRSKPQTYKELFEQVYQSLN